MKSPFHITYADLIREQETRLGYMKSTYPGMVKTGQMNDWSAKHKIALQEQLVKMLRKHKQNPQLNLEDLFNQSKS